MWGNIENCIPPSPPAPQSEALKSTLQLQDSTIICHYRRLSDLSFTLTSPFRRGNALVIVFESNLAIWRDIEC